MTRIATIVEGHGEVEAVPILLRRIAELVSPETALEIPRPIRIPRNKVVRAGELERAIGLAAARAGVDGCILLLLDTDDDCPAHLAPQLLERAVAVRPDRAIRVVLAKMEYEAWFLAAAMSLAGRAGIDEAVEPPEDAEGIRNAKGWLTARMPPGQSYRETIHQASFSAIFDLDAARSAPSFDKLWRDVGALILAPESGNERR